jgi:hypothetical protein
VNALACFWVSARRHQRLLRQRQGAMKMTSSTSSIVIGAMFMSAVALNAAASG